MQQIIPIQNLKETGELVQMCRGLVVVCPISGASRQYLTWVSLDGKTATRGFVLCEHVRTTTNGVNPFFPQVAISP